ncbi:MAG: hypothetical protein R2747_11880 [Pyrinomonadaceae bacterium]
MKRIIWWTFGFILFSAFKIAAQGPPPPAPVIETDMRQNTIKMRSIELERIKREAHKANPPENNQEREIKFAAIKEDFEKIQKLQESIVKTYTTGKEINYLKIGEMAANMKKNALRLENNLFDVKPDQLEEKEHRGRKSVRDLIIELDDVIGKFVGNPIFQNTKVVDPKASEDARTELEKILFLSEALSQEAKRM